MLARAHKLDNCLPSSGAIMVCARLLLLGFVLGAAAACDRHGLAYKKFWHLPAAHVGSPPGVSAEASKGGPGPTLH
jgi:hypothetical protein